MNHKYLAKWKGMKNRKRNSTVTPYEYTQLEQLDKLCMTYKPPGYKEAECPKKEMRFPCDQILKIIHF
jgi:hypothetical protein